MTSLHMSPRHPVRANDGTDSPSLTSGRLPSWFVPAVLVALVGFVNAAWWLQSKASGGHFTAIVPTIVALVASLVIVYVASRIVEGRRRATNRAMSALIWGAFILAVLPLTSLLYTVIASGSARFDTMFFTNSMRNVVGQGGGAIHAITGTLLVTGMAAVISIPVGLFSAIYLVEYGRGNLARAITFFVDVMTGIPSIVAGLFAYALFLLIFGPGTQNGFAGAIALSVLMIPTVVRSSEEMLRLVPNELREGALALGVPRWLMVVKVVLPTAIAGITTGAMLAIARVIGETAPLLIVAGFTQSMNRSLFDGPMMTLPVFVYNSYMSQGVDAQAYIDRAWAGALTLILIVMALNLVGRLVARFYGPDRTR